MEANVENDDEPRTKGTDNDSTHLFHDARFALAECDMATGLVLDELYLDFATTCLFIGLASAVV